MNEQEGIQQQAITFILDLGFVEFLNDRHYKLNEDVISFHNTTNGQFFISAHEMDNSHHKIDWSEIPCRLDRFEYFNTDEIKFVLGRLNIIELF